LAGILGIDLDTAELRLVELNQTAAGYLLHAALALPTGTLDAAALGAQLKERLASVGFKGTTAVIALSHDAMTCREVRHPNIPAEELPAIVQFQVMKESSLPPDDAIVDYVPLAQPLSTGERRSLTFVVRKSRVQFCEKMCEAAGLKLLAVVPRSVALLAGVIKNKAETNVAVGYACSNSFFVMYQGELIFNRSMGTPLDMDDLISELRRSIAGYENQAQMPPLDHVNLAGTELPVEAEKQIDSFRVPVKLFDPYVGIVGADRLTGHGDYAVACGAAQTIKAFKKPPVEFLSPKKVFVKPNRTRSYAIIGGAAVAALALLTYGIYWMMTSSADAEIAELQKSIEDKHKLEKIHLANEVEKRYDAIKAWKDQEVYVLEEIYDLIESFPDVPGVQIIKAEWKANAAAPTTPGPAPMAVPGKTAAPAANTFSKTAPVKPVARLLVKATAEEEDQLNALQTALKNSKHWKWVKFEVVPQEKNTKIFELDVLPLKPEDYRATIALGNNISATGDGSGSNRRGPNRGFRPTTGGRP
jgi:Tfp pilus assembly PilM family ATPase